MRKNYLIALLLGFSVMGLNAQSENYRLDSYVNPDYKRKSLDFDFGAGGRLNSFKVKDSHDYDEQNLSGNLKLNYNLIRNSEKIQDQVNSYIILNGNFFNRERDSENDWFDNDKLKEKNYSIAFDFSKKSYNYLWGLSFLELSPSASFSFKKEHDKRDGVNIEDNKDVNIDINFSLGIGKGRIEQVGDARHAMYILEDLRKNNFLKRNLNEEEVNAFARKITSLKYKRQFDSRIRLIEEITGVDSFLVANGFVDKENPISYSTSLYDNWMYAGLIERLSGTRYSFGITPKYYYYYHKYIDYDNLITINESYVYSGKLYFTYKYEKPVNLYWQRSADITISQTLGKIKDDDDPFYVTELEGYYKLGYYPNSRTYMTGSLNQNFSYMNAEFYNEFVSRTSVDFDMYYYLSPQLRLKANCSLSYYYLNQDNDDYSYTGYYKYPNFSFSFGLQYSIF